MYFLLKGVIHIVAEFQTQLFAQVLSYNLIPHEALVCDLQTRTVEAIAFRAAFALHFLFQLVSL